MKDWIIRVLNRTTEWFIVSLIIFTFLYIMGVRVNIQILV